MKWPLADRRTTTRDPSVYDPTYGLTYFIGLVFEAVFAYIAWAPAAIRPRVQTTEVSNAHVSFLRSWMTEEETGSLRNKTLLYPPPVRSSPRGSLPTQISSATVRSCTSGDEPSDAAPSAELPTPAVLPVNLPTPRCAPADDASSGDGESPTIVVALADAATGKDSVDHASPLGEPQGMNVFTAESRPHCAN